MVGSLGYPPSSFYQVEGWGVDMVCPCFRLSSTETPRRRARKGDESQPCPPAVSHRTARPAVVPKCCRRGLSALLCCAPCAE